MNFFRLRILNEIRALNREFIRLQQTHGIKITNPGNGSVIETYKTGGAYTLEGTFENEPGPDIFGFSQHGGKWWPQSEPLTVIHPKKWKCRFHFGRIRDPSLATSSRRPPLGADFVEYYRKIRDENLKRIGMIRERLADKPELLAQVQEGLPGSYPGINFGGSLPKGLQILDMVTVEIARPPREVISPRSVHRVVSAETRIGATGLSRNESFRLSKRSESCALSLGELLRLDIFLTLLLATCFIATFV